MKHMLLLVVSLIVLSATLTAGITTPCATDVQGGSQSLDWTLSSLSTAGGCIDQDKFYSNFTWTGINPAQIDVEIWYEVNPSGLDVHYVRLSPLTGVLYTPFTFGYNISVQDPDKYIAIATWELDAILGSGTKTLNTTINLNPNQVWTGHATSIDVAVTVTPSLAFGMSSVTDAYIQADVPTGIPEPSTYALFGGGLLALGIVRRRRK